MIQSNRIACFVNEDAFVEKDRLHGYLDRIRSGCSVFIGHGNSNDAASLCVNVDARYHDFEFVLLLNPMSRQPFEDSLTLSQRHDYYLRSLIGGGGRLHEIVDLLGCNPYEGLLMPSRDFFKAHFLRYYEQWSVYSKEVKEDFSMNGIVCQFPLGVEPLRLENNCAVFRTSALDGLSDMQLKSAEPEKMAFLLPLFVQHNGFLPAYCDNPELVSNGMYGREYLELTYPIR